MYKFLMMCLAVAVMIASCGGDAPGPKKESITGTWVFDRGALNGDEAQGRDMFAGFEIEFTADGKMRSAILEQLEMPGELPFDLDGMRIVPKEGDVVFEIKTLTEQELTLHFAVSRGDADFDLLMTFKRKK